ncbi:MAG: beta-galactosidase [Armatimonadetes bacterium]|nr:beta-galactosidase [Armatimonadota bacterium]
MPRPPYLGAAYYPEDWPREQIDADIALMLEAGMNVMRLAEFAWSTMEPRQGQFEFGWLHEAVDKLGAAGIGSILGTPSATPPAWLTERYPEVLFVTDEGRRPGHGSRCHCCPNSPVYRDHCARIVTKMGEEFGADPNVIGWQIDNEVHPMGAPWPARSCCCPVCRARFAERLAARFGTVEALNQAWCLSLWSQAYDSFEQVPVPNRVVWHHPSLLAEWAEFASDSYVDFVAHQAHILHRHTKAPVGTDMMPLIGVDHVAANRVLDLVQYNHYNDERTLHVAAFWFDYMRGIKPTVPFWNTETQTGWNGSVAVNGGNKPPGWCRANSWLPIALGGEANLYWLWRQHWTGHEQMHGAVVSSCGRPLSMFAEVREIADGYRAASDFLAETEVVSSGLGVMFSTRTARWNQYLPIAAGFDYVGTIVERIHRPLLEAQYRPDVVTPSTDLSGYQTLVVPFLYNLDEDGLRARLVAWVEAGGTLVIGPLSDVRDANLGKYRHAPFGSLEEWAGVYTKFSVPGGPVEHELSWLSGGQEWTGSLWADGFEARGAEELALWSSGPLRGLAAATMRSVGSGRVVLLGTLLPAQGLDWVLRQCGVAPVATAGPRVVLAQRRGESRQGAVLVELEGVGGTFTAPLAGVDLLSGDRFDQQIPMEPFGVRVIEQ